MKILVFGSNLNGWHGKGGALYAVKHYNAIYGVPEGIQGRAYAIPTKDKQMRSLPLHAICEGVERFLLFSVEHQELNFQVTRLGCGLAGYTNQQIAPFFEGAPEYNVALPYGWREIIRGS